jgi:hypothetical protein
LSLVVGCWPLAIRGGSLRFARDSTSSLSALRYEFVTIERMRCAQDAGVRAGLWISMVMAGAWSKVL